MLHAAIARPDKVAALVGVAVAADHLVTAFRRLPIEVKLMVVCCAIKIFVKLKLEKNSVVQAVLSLQVFQYFFCVCGGGKQNTYGNPSVCKILCL